MRSAPSRCSARALWWRSHLLTLSMCCRDEARGSPPASTCLRALQSAGWPPTTPPPWPPTCERSPESAPPPAFLACENTRSVWGRGSENYWPAADCAVERHWVRDRCSLKIPSDLYLWCLVKFTGDPTQSPQVTCGSWKQLVNFYNFTAEFSQIQNKRINALAIKRNTIVENT